MSPMLGQGVAMAVWLFGLALVVFTLIEKIGQHLNRYQRLRAAASGLGRTTWVHSVVRSGGYRLLEEALELAEFPVRPPTLLAAMAGAAGFAYGGAGWLIRLLQMRYALDRDRTIDVSDPYLELIFAVLLGSLPLLGVLFRVQRRRQRIALELIDAVQNLIGTFHGKETVGEWIRKADATMPVGIRGEWTRLTIAIRSQGAKRALYEFARRVDNHWADDLADIMLVRAESGHDVTRSLHKLVRDMQTAKSNEQKRRAAISVYRVGTVFMVASAFFVIGFNIRADPNNYRYYFLQPTGRMILMLSLLVLFASMLAVVWSGRKRI